MRTLLAICALAVSLAGPAARGEPAAGAAPYNLVMSVKAGGEGYFDYVYADVGGRRLYIPRTGPGARVTVLNLDTLQPVGEITSVSGHGAAVDPKSGHGFSSSKPVVMWDTATLAPLKTIGVEGNPDGILGDPSNQRIYVLSHTAPNITVVSAVDGAVLGTIDIGGAPEQAVTDGRGHLYVDVEDKDQVAVIDTKSFTKTGAYSLGGQCGTPAGLAFDVKHHVLFVACRNPAVMAMLDSATGKILGVLPIGAGVDGAVFNPATQEAFSSQGDGTLTVIKEISPTQFVVEQTVQTKLGAKTLTLDSKTGRLFLIAAEFGAPPPPAPDAVPAPAGRPRRGPIIPGSFSVLVVGR